MGAACSNVSKTVTDVIPDRDVMIGIVDQIVAFEEMLKQGEPLSKRDQEKLKQMNRVASEMKKMNKRDMKVKARDGMDTSRHSFSK